MSDCFILLAAGKGKRFSSNMPKQYINYKNKPLFMHSIDKALKSNLFKQIIVVTDRKIKLKNKIIKIIKSEVFLLIIKIISHQNHQSQSYPLQLQYLQAF